MKKILTVVVIMLGGLILFALYSIISDRNRIRNEFSEYEESCMSFTEFLINDAKSTGKESVVYFVHKVDGNDKLFRIDDNGNQEITLSALEEEDFKNTGKAFYKMTGRYGITDIVFTNDYVVFEEEQYGGKMIYSIHGGIDKENRKTSQKYQVFRKINDSWYVVFIDAL